MKPKLREKIWNCNGLTQFFDPINLPKEVGGTFEYDHNKWIMTQLAKEEREHPLPRSDPRKLEEPGAAPGDGDAADADDNEISELRELRASTRDTSRRLSESEKKQAQEIRSRVQRVGLNVDVNTATPADDSPLAESRELRRQRRRRL